jgi:mannose-6-phosphate isomerase class I
MEHLSPEQEPMTQLYPLLMQPLFDPRPWGTLDLSAIYPNHKFNERIGEAWLTGDNSLVTNGPLGKEKRSLADLSKEFGADLVGTAARDPQRFPLLLKFLFPEDKLSVQVHPDDATAQRFGEPWGKTECWYVAHAKPGAQIGLGLKPGVTVSQLEKAIHDQTAQDLLNWINVYQGEMIYVTAGTVHSIGPGAVLMETQQQSDTTYRLYDYGRPRPLHLERGLASVKEHSIAGKVIRPAPVNIQGSKNRESSMIAAPYFTSTCFLVSGYRFTACGKSRVCACFWVAQRFTAAITGLFSAPALAAAVTLRREKHFFRSLFSDTEHCSAPRKDCRSLWHQQVHEHVQKALSKVRKHQH